MYCNAIAAGGEAEWDFAWEQFQSTSIAIEADKLRAALACAKEPWLLNRSTHTHSLKLRKAHITSHDMKAASSAPPCRYLDYTLDPQKIRKQDATSTIVHIASNVIGQPLAWDFVQAQWSYIFNQ